MTDERTRPATCQLCGHVGADVTVGLAWYRDGRGVQDIDRCTDPVACQSRVDKAGRPWPLLRTGDELGLVEGVS